MLPVKLISSILIPLELTIPIKSSVSLLTIKVTPLIIRSIIPIIPIIPKIRSPLISLISIHIALVTVIVPLMAKTHIVLYILVRYLTIVVIGWIGSKTVVGLIVVVIPLLLIWVVVILLSRLPGILVLPIVEVLAVLRPALEIVLLTPKRVISLALPIHSVLLTEIAILVVAPSSSKVRRLIELIEALILSHIPSIVAIIVLPISTPLVIIEVSPTLVIRIKRWIAPLVAPITLIVSPIVRRLIPGLVIHRPLIVILRRRVPILLTALISSSSIRSVGL